MNRRVLWILLATVAAFLILGVGAAGGAALTYFALRGSPALANGLEERLPNLLGEEGIAIKPVTQEDEDPAFFSAEDGVVVASIDPEGPAAIAGIARGDILLSLSGEKLDQPGEFFQLLMELNPGDTVELEVQHGDEQRTVSVELGDKNGRAYLGIGTCGVSVDRALTILPGGLEGVLVIAVVPDGPAEAAGLSKGDIITALDGEQISPENSLPDLLADHKPGDKVTLTVQRPGEEARQVEVTLGEDQDEAGKAVLGVRVAGSGLLEPGEAGGLWRALPFDGLPPFERHFNFEPQDLPAGVSAAILVGSVTDGSPAASAGILQGDLIAEIDGQPVEDPQSLRKYLEGRQPGDRLNMTIVRKGENETQKIEVVLGEDPDEPGKPYLGLTTFGFIQVEDNGEGDGSGVEKGLKQFFFSPPQEKHKQLPGEEL